MKNGHESSAFSGYASVGPFFPFHFDQQFEKNSQSLHHLGNIIWAENRFWSHCFSEMDSFVIVSRMTDAFQDMTKMRPFHIYLLWSVCVQSKSKFNYFLCEFLTHHIYTQTIINDDDDFEWRGACSMDTRWWCCCCCFKNCLGNNVYKSKWIFIMFGTATLLVLFIHFSLPSRCRHHRQRSNLDTALEHWHF